MKLEIPKNAIDKSTIIKKKITHSDEHESLVEEANEEIKGNRNKQFKAIQQAKNYVHSYNDLPVAKSNK